MEAYKIEKKIATNGVLHFDAIPFQEGELIEVIMLGSKKKIEKHGCAESFLERRRYGYEWGDTVVNRNGRICFGENLLWGHRL